MSHDEDGEDVVHLQRLLRYEGEDTSPTRTRELDGWYAYPVAAEVFAVVAVGTYRLIHENYAYAHILEGAFLPVILEQLARENGVFFSDRTKPCVDISGAGRLRMRDEKSQKETEQCMIHFLGITMSTSSFAMYTFSSAVLVQALTLVCFSSFADYGT
jgi:UMF1 family MFS transporter